MEKLAINGGTPIFDATIKRPAWPPTTADVAGKLVEIYYSHAWSFYGALENQFTEEYAKFTGANYCVMMANGTVTLECALKTLGIGPGDEVIVPAHTWLATGTAVIYVGATPVVVDVEPDTICMNPAAFEAAITPKTKAVIPVHLFGSMADMDKIMEIARKHNLFVIEDCAHAHGGQWDGKGLGSIGDIGSWSLQESKLMTSGEGGAVTTNNEHYWDILGRLSHIGYQRGAKQGEKSTPPEMGLICHNYRVTEFQAAILLGQLARLAEDTEKREQAVAFLRENINAIPGVKLQARGRKATRQNYYVLGFLVDHNMLKPGKTIDDIVAAFKAENFKGIGRGWGAPMYRHRLWTVPQAQYRIESKDVCEDVVSNQLLVMSHPWLLADQSVLNKIVEMWQRVMAEYVK